MAEPARRHPHGEEQEPDDEYPVFLHRWVERPDGSLELLEMPLTPEDFLDPQLEDQWVQGIPHSHTALYLFGLLDRHFGSEEEILVLFDTKLLLGPGLPGPAPDLAVVFGARGPDPEDVRSFNVIKQGVRPSLIIELVSDNAGLRRTDEVDKVKLYERVGIPEYLLLELPRKANRHQFRVKGFRLSPERRYRPLEPDAEGFLLSETTQLRFGTSEAGDRIEVFDARTGKKLLSPRELDQAWKTAEAARKAAEQGRQRAEKKAAQEEAAREAAEAELERLRAEIERLRSGR
ncbi:MAG TPA: Uma2 family endonuclease [Thermoanaerobaculia bacterium]|nr:Uma2 family endonuclease [Thermoanaerobaculia bacterium]